MNKKALILPLFFFFIFSSMMQAQQPIEHLAWASTVRESIDVNIVYPYSYAEYTVEPFLTFHVPSSIDTKVLFLDVEAKVFFKFTSHPTRHLHCRILWKFLSDAVPDDIEAYYGWGAYVQKETNNSGDYNTSTNGTNNHVKIAMERNSLDRIIFIYKSGGYVPDDIALPILKKLIKRGFDLEVWASFELEGVEQIYLNPVSIHVTQLSKE